MEKGGEVEKDREAEQHQPSHAQLKMPVSSVGNDQQTAAAAAIFLWPQPPWPPRRESPPEHLWKYVSAIEVIEGFRRMVR